MSPGTWHCRLYGHDWRHPGPLEVVVTGEGLPVYPQLCPHCGDVTVLDRAGDRWHPSDPDGPSIHDDALERHLDGR